MFPAFLKMVAELDAFGFQISLVVRVRCNFNRNGIRNFQAIAHEPGPFHRVVGNEPHFPDTNILRDINHAREITRKWIREYNEERPHESLGDKTPIEYAA